MLALPCEQSVYFFVSLRWRLGVGLRELKAASAPETTLASCAVGSGADAGDASGDKRSAKAFKRSATEPLATPAGTASSVDR